MGITLPFWAQPRANRLDDRKLPNRFALAIDAKLPLYHRRFEAGGIYRWLVEGVKRPWEILSSNIRRRQEFCHNLHYNFNAVIAAAVLKAKRVDRALQSLERDHFKLRRSQHL